MRENACKKMPRDCSDCSLPAKKQKVKVPIYIKKVYCSCSECEKTSDCSSSDCSYHRPKKSKSKYRASTSRRRDSSSCSSDCSDCYDSKPKKEKPNKEKKKDEKEKPNKEKKKDEKEKPKPKSQRKRPIGFSNGSIKSKKL